MRLVTSTGDFSCYLKTVTEKIENYKVGKFRYINLEQTGTIPELMNDEES